MAKRDSELVLAGLKNTSILRIGIEGTWSSLEFSRFFFDLNALHEGIILYEIHARQISAKFDPRKPHRRNTRFPRRNTDSLLKLYGDEGSEIPKLMITSVNFNSPGKVISRGIELVINAMAPTLANALEARLSPDQIELKLEKERLEIDRIRLDNRKAELENMQTAISIAVELKQRLGVNGPIEDEIDFSHAATLQNHPLLGPALGLSNAISGGKISTIETNSEKVK